MGVGAGHGQKISITFDQVMSPAYTAWLGRSSLAPDIDLDTKVSPDCRTMAVTANLEPGKVYVLAINEKRIAGVGFQNELGFSAPPYYLVFQTAGTPAPAEAPPKVAKTSPPADAQQIDPTKQPSIIIEFDSAMKPEKHGLHLFEDDHPIDLSDARFGYSTDGKRFSIVYALQPFKTYRVEMNDVHDIGFRNAARIPLWPAKFSFTTGPASPPP